MRLLWIALLALSVEAQSLERAERLWREQQFNDANNAFRALVDANPKSAHARVRWGRLFLERFNPGEAAKLFQEALEIDKSYAPAYLGLAMVAAEQFEARASELAQTALKHDPKLIEAQELLAKVALEDNNHTIARTEADKALLQSDNALDAMAVHATIDWLEDKTDSPWMAKILAKEPKRGEAYAFAAHIFVLNRRYEEGIRYYRKALELKPTLRVARIQLGINLMRLGEEDEARRLLEQAYEQGDRNNLVVNTLTLMDSYKRYKTFKTANTVLRLRTDEADLLRPYFEGELKRAIATFEKKYKLKLDRPVQVEVYPDHEDFAVRTLGMPGLGALGVTFGYTVAMDSPSGRKPGTFHWASTLWHELSHVFVLAATKHRVPRWFTEGMAVHEETAASPDWGDRMDPTIVDAITKNKLLPIAELDRGFVRQAYPGQVVVSYFQAGRICDYINEKYGYDKLLAMMRDFGENRVTTEVIRRQFNMAAPEFDKAFMGWLDAKTRSVIENFPSWRAKVKDLHAMAENKKFDDLIREGGRTRDWFPEYVENGSVYDLLAEAYLAKGDKVAAIRELERYAHIGGREPSLIVKLADLLTEAGRKKEAAAALDRLNLIYPMDGAIHRKLGELWLDTGDTAGAIREFRAVLAAKPQDPAASHYNLARAYRQANQMDQAREHLLEALEAAPSFKPAQKLLLEINR